MDADINEMFARRDAFRRKLEARITIAERVAEMFDPKRLTPPGHDMSEAGYQHFLRRNFRARAIDRRYDDSPR